MLRCIFYQFLYPAPSYQRYLPIIQFVDIAHLLVRPRATLLQVTYSQSANSDTCFALLKHILAAFHCYLLSQFTVSFIPYS